MSRGNYNNPETKHHYPELNCVLGTRWKNYLGKYLRGRG